jgi:hypothetical protein
MVSLWRVKPRVDRTVRTMAKWPWLGGYSGLLYCDLQSGKIESTTDPVTTTLGDMLVEKPSDCILASIPI